MKNTIPKSIKPKSMNSKINVMIVDDHPLILMGLKNILKNCKNINISAEASNGRVALSILNNENIDLVISDIKMPEIDGIELTKQIKREYPDIKVILLTLYDNEETLKRAFNSGAESCLLKNTSKKELINIISKVFNDEYYYCKEVMAVIQRVSKIRKPQTAKLDNLSKREMDVFELLIKGFSNNDISETLFISYNTVRTHRKNILNKTKSKSFLDLYNFTLENNLFNYIEK